MVFILLQLMEEQWLAKEYSPVMHNSVHFCQQLCNALQVQPVPAWVLNEAVTDAIAGSCSSSAQGHELAFCSSAREPVVFPRIWDQFDEDGDIDDAVLTVSSSEARPLICRQNQDKSM